MAGLFAQAASDSTMAATQWRFATMVVSVFAVVWAADRIGRTVRRIYATIWQVSPARSAWLWLRPLGVIGISIFAFSAGSLGVRAADHGVAVFVSVLVANYCLITLLWLVVSRALPHAPEATGWKAFLPGSLLMGAAIISVKAVTVIFFSIRASTLEARYGSIGIVLIMLSWSYLISLATVASADLNAAVFSARK
jgi:membrane protein